MQEKYRYNNLPMKPCDLLLGCPECGGHDGYLNYNRLQIARCDDHKTMWHAGSNIIGAWRDEDWETWESNAKFLECYRYVEPRTFQAGLDEENYRIKQESGVAIGKMIESLGWREVVDLVLSRMPTLTQRDLNDLYGRVNHFARENSHVEEFLF